MASATAAEIATDLYRIPIDDDRAHILNFYIWRSPGGAATVIDTGWPGSLRMVLDGLEQLHLTPSDVERIVLTHFHEDHAGSATDLSAMSGAEVVVGASDAAVVKGLERGAAAVLTDAERGLHGPEGEFAVSPPRIVRVREVSDGDVLDGAGAMRVVSVPGHTPGSIAIFFPDLRSVLTGDVAAEFHGAIIRGAFHTDRDLVRRSVRRLAELDVDVAGFGHGEPVLSDAADRLRTATDPLA